MTAQLFRIMPATPAQTALLAHLHSFPRDKLERTIEALIAICDMMDGDPDREEDDPAEQDDVGEDDDPDHEHDGREPENVL